MNRKRLFLSLCMVLCILLPCGCKKWQWADFKFINLSREQIYVKVHGVDPDPSPGNMPPNPDEDGSRAGSHFGDRVVFDDVITITWTIKGGSTTNEMKFNRSDLGIPAKASGGKFTATYTAAGEWEVKYSR